MTQLLEREPLFKTNPRAKSDPFKSRPPASRKPIVDLSIDFDFFCREDPAWDFQCAEIHHPESQSFYKQTVWALRYASHDLYEGTDITRHADFDPRMLVWMLVNKGLCFSPATRAKFIVADSHRFAYPFFRYQNPPDYLVNIDAHHDFWDWHPMEGPALNCGNWGTALFDEWEKVSMREHRPNPKFVQVYPRWKNPSLDGKPHRPLSIHSWENWPGIPGGCVRNVFLCRSPEWVAPHHDNAFFSLIGLLSSTMGSRCAWEELPTRKVPTREEAQAQQQSYQRSIRRLQDMGVDASRSGGGRLTPEEVNNVLKFLENDVNVLSQNTTSSQSSEKEP